MDIKCTSSNWFQADSSSRLTCPLSLHTWITGYLFCVKVLRRVLMSSLARIVRVRYSRAYLWTFGNFASVILSSNLKYNQYIKGLAIDRFNTLVKRSLWLRRLARRCLSCDDEGSNESRITVSNFCSNSARENGYRIYVSWCKAPHPIYVFFR